MFARKVSVRLKENRLDDFVGVIENQIVPWLRKQAGFLDLITLAHPDGSEVATISFWDQESSACAYAESGYPEVITLLEGMLDGRPYVKTFVVVSSTFQDRSQLEFQGADTTASAIREQLSF